MKLQADVDLSLHAVASVAAIDAADTLLQDVQKWSVEASSELARELLSDVGIPVVSTALTVVGLFVAAFQSAAKQAEDIKRAYAAMESSMRPISTGSGGVTMPADIMGSYLRSTQPVGRHWRHPGIKGHGEIPDDYGLEGPDWPTCFRGPNAFETGPDLLKVCLGNWTKDIGGGTARARNALMPALGAALWVRATGRALNYASEPNWPPYTSRLRRSGTTQVREDFEKVAREIAAQRGIRGTDGGALKWPILLDIVRGAGTTESWARQMAQDTHGVRYPQSHAAVTELLRRWELTRDPIYSQDRAELEKLRAEIWRRARHRVFRVTVPPPEGLVRRIKNWLNATIERVRP